MLGVKLIHLLRELRERHVAELPHQSFHLGLRAQRAIFVPAEGGAVEVGLALASPAQQALAVEPRHHGHIGGVRARLLRAAVQTLHQLAHAELLVAPGLVHDLGLELVQRRRYAGTSFTYHDTTQYSTSGGVESAAPRRPPVQPVVGLLWLARCWRSKGLLLLVAHSGAIRAHGTVLQQASSARLYSAAAFSSRSMAAR